jgi:hypothetical protein
MFGYRLKIEGELLERSQKCAEASGYASVDEFLLHTIEKEVTRLLGSSEGGSDTAEEVKKRLQGLGYIE